LTVAIMVGLAAVAIGVVAITDPGAARRARAPA
jgi:hypothetical protein